MSKCTRTLITSLCTVIAICMSVEAYEWTDWTSEKYGPVVCAKDKFSTGFGCLGSHCSWVRLECHNPASVGNLTDRHWLPQVSEESPNARYCPYGEYISGVSTSGTSSDNISLECAKASGIRFNACRWTSQISEENGGTLLFYTGYYGVGMQCRGSFCDNKRFYICRSD
jgi:hypothetical protein